MSFEKSFESLMDRVEGIVDGGYKKLATIATDVRREIGSALKDLHFSARMVARAGAAAILFTTVGGMTVHTGCIQTTEEWGDTLGCIPRFPNRNLGTDAGSVGTDGGEGSDSGTPPDDDAAKKDSGEREEAGTPDTGSPLPDSTVPDSGTPLTDAGEGSDLAKDAAAPLPDVPSGDDIPQARDLGQGSDLATGTDAIIPIPDEGTPADILQAPDAQGDEDIPQVQVDLGSPAVDNGVTPPVCPPAAACNVGMGDCALPGTPVCNGDGQVTACLGQAGVPQELHIDGDGDGVGGDDTIPSCNPNKPGTSPVTGDCDDDDPNNFPGNLESCDGQMNDCGTGGAADRPGSLDCQDVHIDADGDGDGAVGSPANCLCPNPDGTMPEFTSLNDADCNDADHLINQNAEEMPNNLIDENCNGWTDEAQGEISIRCNDDGSNVTPEGQPVHPCEYQELIQIPSDPLGTHNSVAIMQPGNVGGDRAALLITLAPVGSPAYSDVSARTEDTNLPVTVGPQPCPADLPDSPEGLEKRCSRSPAWGNAGGESIRFTIRP